MASNRFGYQHTWTLCHLLRLHASDQAYVVILEYHDDVLTIDNEKSPAKVDFFQVKTRKSGHWKSSDLLARQKAATAQSAPAKTSKETNGILAVPESIVGKLMDHCRSFLTQVESLNIVSNATFDLPVASPPPSTDRDRICLADLDSVSLEDIKSKIGSELKCAIDLPWNKVFLMTSGINITDHDTYGAGELSKYLDKRRPGGRFAVQPLYRTLCAEVRRRADNEWQPISFEELCKKKGLRRVDLEEFLQHAERQPDPEKYLAEVRGQLLSEGLQYRSVVEIVAAWHRYSVERIDQTNIVMQEFCGRIVEAVEEAAASTAWQTLREYVAEAASIFEKKHGAITAPFDSKLMQGAILYEYKAYESRQHSPSHSESSPEEP